MEYIKDPQARIDLLNKKEKNGQDPFDLAQLAQEEEKQEEDLFSMEYIIDEDAQVNSWNIPFGVKVLVVVLIVIGALGNLVYWGQKNQNVVNATGQVE